MDVKNNPISIKELSKVLNSSALDGNGCDMIHGIRIPSLNDPRDGSVVGRDR